MFLLSSLYHMYKPSLFVAFLRVVLYICVPYIVNYFVPLYCVCKHPCLTFYLNLEWSNHPVSWWVYCFIYILVLEKIVHSTGFFSGLASIYTQSHESGVSWQWPMDSDLWTVTYRSLIWNSGNTFTQENHCTRTAQSSRVGCSRHEYKIMHLAVKDICG